MLELLVSFSNGFPQFPFFPICRKDSDGAHVLDSTHLDNIASRLNSAAFSLPRIRAQQLLSTVYGRYTSRLFFT